jgi:predicted AlkP superfamily phosphohydrolase/phosphomutase
MNLHKKYKRVIMLLADGARPDVMNELIARGELPAIENHLVNPGSNVTAVTAFPSTTGPAYLPFLTGCLPATCNVPGIRWMDKVRYAKSKFGLDRHRSYVGLETYLLGRDMRREHATLFELLKDSYNIFNSVHKGVTFKRNMTRISRIWYWYYAYLTDRWSFVDKAAIKKFRKRLLKDFEMIFIILPGIDEYSHFAHYKHSQTIDSYKLVDQAVNIAYSELSERGKWDDTLFLLISDHGLSVTHTHFCINEFLEQRGIKTLYYPKIIRGDCSAANMMSGNGMSHVYLRHDHGWQYPMYRSDIDMKYPGLLNDLVGKEAVDILGCRLDQSTVEIVTKRGVAKVKLEGDWLRYQVNGADPFGYENMKDYLRADEFLELTKDSDYPDAVYQLAHLFTSARAGDVVLSAAKGYDFRKDYEVPEHKGSHGSLHKEHMLVPLISNAKISGNTVRTVDVFPTVLKLLGHPIPANIDGKSLV